jgi:hypothetical protein
MTPKAGTEAPAGRKADPSKTDDAEAIIRRALRDCLTDGELRPNTILLRRSVYWRLARPGMTKRGFRRWRARMKAAS